MNQPTQFSLDGLEWPLIHASRRVLVDEHVWHVQQLGAGPEVLLIHGTGASCHSWEGLAKELAPQFALTIIDLPGHGFSAPLPPDEMRIDVLAHRIGSLLTALDVQPALVIGHSAGAAIAVRMALDGWVSPLGGIVAINGALLPFDGIGRWLLPTMARVLAAGSLTARLLALRAGKRGAVAHLLAGTGSKPPVRSIAFYERMLRRPSQIQAALDMMANWDLEGLAVDLPRLSVPLELIACSDDSAVPPETAFNVRDLRPETNVRYIRGLGHLAHEEDPASVAALVRAAWQQQASVREAFKVSSAPIQGWKSAP